ncbi:MAG: hypothetical protein HKN19_02305 [Halioglobus sp.]|nr:hypothetical protein [Halioglobus sp.]
MLYLRSKENAVITGYLLLLPAVLLLVTSAVFAQVDPSESRFVRTVNYLHAAPAALRAEFAALALERLHHVYSAEAELARDEFARNGEDSDLLRWSAAVEQFAAKLPLSVEEIRAGNEVALRIAAQEGVVVQVAGRVLLLVHPRPGQQAAFERDVLNLFCARQPCDQFTPGTVASEPIPVSRGDIRPQWRFSGDGARCSFSGVTVKFGSNARMAQRRSLCVQLMNELFTLADEIAWQHRHAVEIEWDRLHIEASPRRPDHSVTLNRVGDSALLVAPLLYGSPGLLAAVRPWLRGRLGDKAEPSLALTASDHGWE